jgi:hypothetical protein
MKSRVFGFWSLSLSESLSVSAFAQYGTADSDTDADTERLGYSSIFGTVSDALWRTHAHENGAIYLSGSGLQPRQVGLIPHLFGI